MTKSNILLFKIWKFGWNAHFQKVREREGRRRRLFKARQGKVWSGKATGETEQSSFSSAQFEVRNRESGLDR
jgi:hypothetical protein